MPTGSQQPTKVAKFFDELYEAKKRYWWRQENRYAIDPDEHTTSLLTQMTLRLAQEQDATRPSQPPRRALDLGAGEGADSIRLALLGYSVDALEISEVGAKKISDFAAEAGAHVNVCVEDIRYYDPGDDLFDIVICNGVLHYVDDKASVVERMQKATRAGGLNVISLWSTHSPVPECHERVPVYCDDEGGIVTKMYQTWNIRLKYFERDKPESSHPGMPDHSHSHIKIIAQKN